jgi:predicted phage baseplate assembly protein
MPLEPPQLDDRRFEDIVAEARALIPRYTREWTDQNESDPGITLIQLFGWMTEMLLYRLNRVPERNYLKFLQLLGIQPRPAQSARAELTFTLNRDPLARAEQSTVIVPKGTRVGAADGGDAGPPVFETERALYALEAELKAMQSFDAFSYTDQTKKNLAQEQVFDPFGPHAREGSALMLGFDSPLPFTDQEVDLAFSVFTGEDRRRPQACDPDLLFMPVPATLVWEYWNGQNWQALSVFKDETRALTRSGHISFRGPGERAAKDMLGDVRSQPLYWLRCRLERGTYERPPRLERILTNTVSATQMITVRDEVLGGSDGRPDQQFTLANRPVVAGEVRDKNGVIAIVSSLQLEVEEAPRFGASEQPRFEPWKEVDDFLSSTADDTHYILNRTTGEIRFGDGVHGRIPVANPDNRSANIVARVYQYGGGRAGNVAAHKITELQSAVQYVDSVTNHRPSYGGTDEEPLKEAKLRAQQVLQSKGRAVTSADFELLARETPGARISRAKALPLVHPRFPGTSIPGVVTVVVIPDSEAQRPFPSEETINVVCAYLSNHRLLTTEVYVVGPTYRKISIEADVVARPEADLAQVKREVEQRLLDYFHPLRGGEAGTGWEFGLNIVYSDIYRQILQIAGVDRIQGTLRVWLDDVPQSPYLDVALQPGELLYSEGHQIRMSYRERE